MVLWSNQPLTEMSTRSIPGGKGGRCVRLTTLPPSCSVVMKSGNLNFLEPAGPLQACNGTALPFVSWVRVSVSKATGNRCKLICGSRQVSCVFLLSSLQPRHLSNSVRFVSVVNYMLVPRDKAGHSCLLLLLVLRMCRAIYSLFLTSDCLMISSSCSWRVRCVSCSLILKMKLVPPSLPRSSYLPSSFCFIL